MTRQFSPDGVPGQDVADYYTRRAAADVGLIITEGTYVDHESAGTSDRVPRFHGEAALAGWGHVADSVHRAGGAIIPQLWHVGVTRTEGAGPCPGRRAGRALGDLPERRASQGARHDTEGPRRRHRRLRRRGCRRRAARASTAPNCTAPTVT